MCCFSSCSFPCWQNTLQNVLLKPASQCFICFLLPSPSLLKASSMPAHELHTTIVPWSKTCLQLEARDVTSAGERCFPRKEYSGHSSHFLADGLYLLRKRPQCFSTKPDCGSVADADPAYFWFSDLLSHCPALPFTSVFSLCNEFVPSSMQYLAAFCELIPWWQQFGFPNTQMGNSPNSQITASTQVFLVSC